MQSVAHILIVDDDLTSQTLLRLALQQAGYIVQVVGTGRAALGIYTSFDLILLDVLLPDMDGFALCAELRKRSQVAIVMLTGLNSAQDIIYGLNLGADDYIVKPYRMREVAVRLRAVLRRCTWKQIRDSAT